MRAMEIMVKSMHIMMRSLSHCHGDLFSLDVWSTVDWVDLLVTSLDLTSWNIHDMSRVVKVSCENLLVSNVSINN